MKPVLRLFVAVIGMYALQAMAATADILVNQVGYELQAPKVAVVAAEPTQTLHEFSVIDASNGRTVLSAVLRDTGTVAKWNTQHYWRADFSALKTPGRYYLQLRDGNDCLRSDEFLVQPNVLERNTLSNVIYYFKGQRASGLMDRADRTLQEVLAGADIFLGLSVPRVLKQEWLSLLGPNPLILALANPEPEILPELVLQSRPVAMMASGRDCRTSSGRISGSGLASARISGLGPSRESHSCFSTRGTERPRKMSAAGQHLLQRAGIGFAGDMGEGGIEVGAAFIHHAVLVGHDDVLRPGADIFLGLSVPRVLKQEWLSLLGPNPLILALANPEPEILPELVLQSRPDAIMATGRDCRTSSGRISGSGLASARISGLGPSRESHSCFSTRGTERPRKMSAPASTSCSVRALVSRATWVRVGSRLGRPLYTTPSLSVMMMFSGLAPTSSSASPCRAC